MYQQPRRLVAASKLEHGFAVELQCLACDLGSSDSVYNTGHAAVFTLVNLTRLFRYY